MADYPSIPQPTDEPETSLPTLMALKESVELLTGQRAPGSGLVAMTNTAFGHAQAIINQKIGASNAQNGEAIASINTDLEALASTTTAIAGEVTDLNTVVFDPDTGETLVASIEYVNKAVSDSTTGLATAQSVKNLNVSVYGSENPTNVTDPTKFTGVMATNKSVDAVSASVAGKASASSVQALTAEVYTIDSNTGQKVYNFANVTEYKSTAATVNSMTAEWGVTVDAGGTPGSVRLKAVKQLGVDAQPATLEINADVLVNGSIQSAKMAANSVTAGIVAANAVFTSCLVADAATRLDVAQPGWFSVPLSTGGTYPVATLDVQSLTGNYLVIASIDTNKIWGGGGFVGGQVSAFDFSFEVLVDGNPTGLPAVWVLPSVLSSVLGANNAVQHQVRTLGHFEVALQIWVSAGTINPGNGQVTFAPHRFTLQCGTPTVRVNDSFPVFPTIIAFEIRR